MGLCPMWNEDKSVSSTVMITNLLVYNTVNELWFDEETKNVIIHVITSGMMQTSFMCCVCGALLIRYGTENCFSL